jgi:SAM-dependent methyltransferase
MRALPLRAGSVEGVAAFYSLIHVPPDELAGAVAEIARVVVPGGWVGIAVHSTHPPERASTAEPIPGGGLRLKEMLSEPVDLDFWFYGLERLTGLLRAAGLEIAWSQEREPYPDVEVQTRRSYVLAKSPAAQVAFPP